jgi:hypothetical protein
LRGCYQITSKIHGARITAAEAKAFVFKDLHDAHRPVPVRDLRVSCICLEDGFEARFVDPPCNSIAAAHGVEESVVVHAKRSWGGFSRLRLVVGRPGENLIVLCSWRVRLL